MEESSAFFRLVKALESWEGGGSYSRRLDAQIQRPPGRFGGRDGAAWMIVRQDRGPLKFPFQRCREQNLLSKVTELHKAVPTLTGPPPPPKPFALNARFSLFRRRPPLCILQTSMFESIKSNMEPRADKLKQLRRFL